MTWRSTPTTANWDRLERQARAHRDDPRRWSLAGRLCLTRPDVRRRVEHAFALPADSTSNPTAVALLGRSGDGKSAVAHQRWATGSPPPVARRPHI